MNRRRSVAFAALLVFAVSNAVRADSLEDVLGRMDAAAKQFKSYSATVKRLDYTKVVDSIDESSGSMRLMRTKNGVVGIMDVTSGPDHTIIHFNGPDVEIYLPKAATVQQFKMRQFASTMDQMLLLGFSVTSDEMKQSYDIKLVGPETVTSTPTTHIVLTPKSAEALKYVKTIELWIPDGKGYAIQQKGNEPSRNYRLATYSNLVLNPTLPDSAFQLTVPKGVKTVKEN